MKQVAKFTALIAAQSNLNVLDPVAGPVERQADALSPSDEVLVFVDGKPCYRSIAQSAPAAPPPDSVVLPAGSLSPGIPRRDLAVAATQMLTIAFPVGTPPAAASALVAPAPAIGGGQWILLTVQGAQAIVAEGMRLEIGAPAQKTAQSSAPPPQELAPLKAHAGARELPPHSIEHEGILSTWCFTVPPRTTTIRLSSVSTKPAGDPRHLGVAIYQLTMDGVPISLDSPALVRGFHRVESNDALSWRWTDGEALLILPPRPAEQVLRVGVTNWHQMLVS
jgi:hypothetical protein